MLLTQLQRAALNRVFNRHSIPSDNSLRDRYHINLDGVPMANGIEVTEFLTYREFRRTVRHGSGCIMVPWAGMWLGIEPDGHTHS